jgi:hypothetical protein
MAGLALNQYVIFYGVIELVPGGGQNSPTADLSHRAVYVIDSDRVFLKSARYHYENSL